MRRHFPWVRRPDDEEVRDELRAHLELATAERIARGESPEEARRAARLELGNVTLVEEDVREVWTVRWARSVAADVRLAVRRLRAAPGFTLVAVLTLALGLSVNATLFSLISSLFLRPLPVKDAERLAVVLRQTEKTELLSGVSWLDFEDLRSGVGEFSDVLALAFRPAHLSVAGGAPDRVWIEAVSENYFAMLGVRPGFGRLLEPGDAAPVAVLGHRYWKTRLGGDPSVVGQAAVINGRSFTVIGIAAESFTSAQWSIAPSAFIPARTMPSVFPGSDTVLERRDSGAFKVMARLRPGATAAQATASADLAVGRDRGEADRSRLIVRPERLTRPEPSFSRFMPFAAAAFLVMAGMVLFVACANVANLLFARAADRERELGIRGALGARRGRLVRQLLTESLVLALLAGLAGAALSYLAGVGLAEVARISGDMPVAADETWDWRPAAAAMAVAVIAGLLTGVVPAWKGTGFDLAKTIQGGDAGGATGGWRRRSWFRSGMVFGQVAMSVVVLASGALFAHSLYELSSHDLGFRPERVLLASVDLKLQGYDPAAVERFLRELKPRLESLPGVEAAAFASDVPFDVSMSMRAVEDGPRAALNRVDADYFRTLGVPLVRGRGLDEGDDDGARRTAVVNETFARRMWPGEEGLGQSFRWKERGEPVEVVGVAADGKYLMLGEAPRPFVYLPLAQEGASPVTVHLRASSDAPLDLVAPLRAAVAEIDPDLPVFNVRSMEEHLRTSVFGFLPLRAAALLAGVQGATALLLAVLGVYGVAAFSLRRRRREIGIRVALGAGRLDVLRAVARAALWPALAGVGLGLPAALGAGRLLGAMLYGVEPLNPVVFAAVAAFTLGVSVSACWWPARRAMRGSPLRSLRP